MFITPALAEATETQSNYMTDVVFKKLNEVTLSGWIILVVLAVLGAILLVIGRSRKRWSAQMIAYAALSIALSFLLSCIRLYRMPQGGSITPGSMLPLMLFASAFGVGPGLAAGLVYGALQYLQGGDFLNVWQFLLDYLIAFAALGLAGLNRHMKARWWRFAVPGVMLALLVVMAITYKELMVLYIVLALIAVALIVLAWRFPERTALLPGMGIAVLGRAVSAILAGLIWVAKYPLENGELPLQYSIIYNGAYLIPELVICMVLAVAIGDTVYRQIAKGR